ncbi:MAG: right-handed parallel beta-helix repeat-containing protein [Acidobacteriota bacterium]
MKRSAIVIVLFRALMTPGNRLPTSELHRVLEKLRNSVPGTHAGAQRGLRNAILVILLGCLILALPLRATDFYIDPATGSPAGDGSAADPWRALQEVIEADLVETRDWESHPYEPGLQLVTVNPGAPVRAGDTLWLRSGYHGDVTLERAYNESDIVIAAENGHTPWLGSLLVQSAQNWVVRGVSVSPSFAPPPLEPIQIVAILDHGFFGPAWDIALENSELFSVEDPSSWSADDWVNLASSGIRITADRITIRRNRLRNVRSGISVSGDDARIRFNEIDGFSADGLRGLGDGGLYEYNTIKNAYVGQPTDPNHDDGFQSWSVGPGGVGTGEVRDVVLRGNVFVNNEDPNHPLHAPLQGIGCFDGLFVNWVVENNVVITDHWHGISFYGMIDSLIVNNTVIDLNDQSPGPPWIRVTESNGTPSENVVVRNNLATDYSIAGVNITEDHNLEFVDAASLFVAPPYDLHLLEASAAVDTGSPNLAPERDADQVQRPQGLEVDLGAYERKVEWIFGDGFESGDLVFWSSSTPLGDQRQD